jgi:parallel beta-helix repeat protein
VSGNSFCSAYQHSIVMEQCHNVSLGTSTIDYNPDYAGDRMDGITISDSSACSLQGLILESTRSGTPASGGGIHIARSSGITLAGCQILDPAHRGIHLESVKNSIISGCTILTRKASPAFRESVLAQKCGPDLLLQGNILSKGERGDLVAEAGSPTISGIVTPG